MDPGEQPFPLSRDLETAKAILGLNVSDRGQVYSHFRDHIKQKLLEAHIPNKTVASVREWNQIQAHAVEHFSMQRFQAYYDPTSVLSEDDRKHFWWAIDTIAKDCSKKIHESTKKAQQQFIQMGEELPEASIRPRQDAPRRQTMLSSIGQATGRTLSHPQESGKLQVSSAIMNNVTNFWRNYFWAYPSRDHNN